MMITSSLAAILTAQYPLYPGECLPWRGGGLGRGARPVSRNLRKLAGARTNRMGPVKPSQPHGDWTCRTYPPPPCASVFAAHVTARTHGIQAYSKEPGARARARVCVLTDIDCVHDREIPSYILFYSMYAVCGTYES